MPKRLVAVRSGRSLANSMAGLHLLDVKDQARIHALFRGVMARHGKAFHGW